MQWHVCKHACQVYRCALSVMQACLSLQNTGIKYSITYPTSCSVLADMRLLQPWTGHSMVIFCIHQYVLYYCNVFCQREHKGGLTILIELDMKLLPQIIKQAKF